MDKVTDKRQPGFFIIDNEVLDDYGLKEIEFFIYSKIMRHSNKNGKGYFSLRKLKKLMKWGNTTVSGCVKALVDKKLVLAELKKGIGYEFEVLPVVKKNRSPVGNTQGEPFPAQEGWCSPHGKGGVPPTGNKEDLTKQDFLKKTIKKEVVTLPFLLTDELKAILEEFNQTAGTKFIADKTLITLWESAKRGWDVDYLSQAVHNYALSTWHHRKFRTGQNAWNLKKFLRNHDGEIPKFHEQNPPAEEGTGYQPIDLENSPDMTEEELNKIIRGNQ